MPLYTLTDITEFTYQKKFSSKAHKALLPYDQLLTINGPSPTHKRSEEVIINIKHY